MKATTLLVLFLLAGFQNFSQEKKQASTTVEITFYNNSILPHKFSFISYAPDEKGNGTNQMVLSPYGKTKLSFKPGTKLYLADSKEIDIVMSGNSLQGKPFMVIAKQDDGKTIELNK